MKRWWIGALAALAACGPGEPAEQKTLLKTQIVAHFAGLNAEAALHSNELVYGTAADESKTRGLTFDTYHYLEEGSIIRDITCPRGECRLKQDVVLYNPKSGATCAACGAKPPAAPEGDMLLKPGLTPETLAAEAEKRGFVVQKMFEEGGEGVTATVRYVRRRWEYDPRGLIEPGPLRDDPKELNARLAPLGEAPTPGVGKEGFHRPLAEWIGEAEFKYDAGRSTIASQKPEIPIRHWTARDHAYEPPGAGN